MNSNLTELTYVVELQAGEAFRLPQEASSIVGPGQWRVSIRPAGIDDGGEVPRDHTAFLNSYAPEDEGLYDDYTAG